jgi:hypothetical protein
MTSAKHARWSVAEAANLFVLSRRPKSLVSLADGIIAVRNSVAECEHTDEELGELVATLAIHHGRNVAFDTSEMARELKSPPTARILRWPTLH